MRAGFRKLATLYQGTGASIQPASAAEGVTGLTLLDIGGGIGAIQHELARAGVDRIASVDASSSYLAVQRAEAHRLGYSPRASYLSGDFVTLADHVPDSDIVTLDRVICCYSDMRSLVSLSAVRARRLYGIVYPRGTWWNAVGGRLMNLLMRLQRTSFRTYLHAPADVDTAIRAQGLRPRFRRQTLVWNV